MSIRNERIASIIKKNVAQIIEFELNDPNVGLVTITDVVVTRDLSMAKIYFMTYSPGKEKTLNSLTRAKGHIRSQLAKFLKTYKTPDLKFIYDDSLEKANHLENLIKKAND